MNIHFWGASKGERSLFGVAVGMGCGRGGDGGGGDGGGGGAALGSERHPRAFLKRKRKGAEEGEGIAERDRAR